MAIFLFVPRLSISILNNFPICPKVPPDSETRPTSIILHDYSLGPIYLKTSDWGPHSNIFYFSCSTEVTSRGLRAHFYSGYMYDPWKYWWPIRNIFIWVLANNYNLAICPNLSIFVETFAFHTPSSAQHLEMSILREVLSISGIHVLQNALVGDLTTIENFSL